MAITDKQTLKNWYVTGAMPLQDQFWAWLDSYWHKQEKIPVDNIDGLQEMLDEFVIDVTAIVTEAAKNLQLERRIAILMETDTTIVPIGEAMKIYKATAKNVSKLEIKPNDASTIWTNIPLNADINIDISNMVATDALIRITRMTTDNTSTLYLFTKVIA